MTRKHLIPVPLFLSTTQLQDRDPTNILQKRLKSIDVDPTKYAHKSWRSGMACTVIHNQAVIKGGKDGLFYGDSLMQYIEANGRWTNSV